MKSTKEVVEILRNLTKRKEGTKDDKVIYIFGDSMTDEIQNILFNGEFRIDDLYYDLFDTWCSDTLDRLNYTFEENQELESFNQLEDMLDQLMGEIEADIYTSDLTSWLNSDNRHVYYMTEAVTELGAKEGFQILSGAQYLWKQEYYHLFNTILEHLIEG